MSVMAESDGLSSKDYWGIGLGAASVLPSLFSDGGASATAEPLRALQAHADMATDLSKSLNLTGSEIFGPAASYLKKVTGGDAQEVLAATMPQRRRVIDQYSAAKNALGEFAPRSGGTAAAGSKLAASEASDLAGISNEARTKGIDPATSAGIQLQGLGLSAASLASGDLNQILSALQQQEENKQKSAGGIGSALGSLLGFVLAA